MSGEDCIQDLDSISASTAVQRLQAHSVSNGRATDQPLVEWEELKSEKSDNSGKRE